MGGLLDDEVLTLQNHETKDEVDSREHFQPRTETESPIGLSRGTSDSRLQAKGVRLPPSETQQG